MPLPSIISIAIRSGLLHSKLDKNTFFYVMAGAVDGDHQTKTGTHGDDLSYIFGAPLLLNGYKLSYFRNNFTKSETMISEAIMSYWSNFVRNGWEDVFLSTIITDRSFVPCRCHCSIASNPNSDPNMEIDSSRNRFERVIWAPYEEQQQHYLAIG